MALNKNGIFSVASLILTIIGIILILLGVLKYEYAIYEEKPEELSSTY